MMPSCWSYIFIACSTWSGTLNLFRTNLFLFHLIKVLSCVSFHSTSLKEPQQESEAQWHKGLLFSISPSLQLPHAPPSSPCQEIVHLGSRCINISCKGLDRKWKVLMMMIMMMTMMIVVAFICIMHVTHTQWHFIAFAYKAVYLYKEKKWIIHTDKTLRHTFWDCSLQVEGIKWKSTDITETSLHNNVIFLNLTFFSHPSYPFVFIFIYILQKPDSSPVKFLAKLNCSGVLAKLFSGILIFKMKYFNV